MKHFNKIVLLLFTVVGLFYNLPIKAADKENCPILIIGLPGHFDTYTGEILKAEGFNEFQIASLTVELSLKYLKRFDLVILTETDLSNQQKEIFTSYVKEGGNLIAFRPDKKLATVYQNISKQVNSLSLKAFVLQDAHVLHYNLRDDSIVTANAMKY